MTTSHAEIDRQAQTLLNHIENQTQYILKSMYRAIEVFINGAVSAEASERLARDFPLSFTQLERCADQWGAAVPSEPELKAVLASRIARQYGLLPGKMPQVWQILELESDAVRAAYTQMYGHPLQELFTDSAPSISLTAELMQIVLWMERDHLRALQDAMTRVQLYSGETLFREGDAGDSMYVISSGRLRAVLNAGQEDEIIITEYGRDQSVGEMALLTGEPRSATIYAIRDTELYRITKDSFDQLVEQYPRILLQMTRTMAQRLKDTTHGVAASDGIRAVAVLPAGPEADITEFAIQLTEALTMRGKALHLNSQQIDQRLEAGTAQVPRETAGEARLLGWLTEQEMGCDFVVYEADTEFTEWTKRCIRQADRILLVAQSERSSALNAIEDGLFNSQELQLTTSKELVLLHSSFSTLPGHTRRWLENRPVANHHHIALDNASHLPRLVRFLRSRPVALVLSGGSIRAFAHIGVLRALREAGIPVDVIGGTSAGSIIGAQYAMGWDDRELEERNLELFSNAKRFMDYTLPVTSFFAGRQFDLVLERIFGDLCIEDLWIKYFCTTVDLTAAQLLTHRTGLLRWYVRASCSMPVVLPPVLENGHLLVDGGLMNNIPVNQMLDVVRSSKVIVVNVTNAFYTADGDYNYGDNLPFWKVFIGRLNPFGKKLILPSLGNILLRSLEIGSKSSEPAQIAKADVYIRPRVEGIGFSDTTSMLHLIQLGYEATQAQLEHWAYAE
jgi:predicted acylesterase/phospholipase RssA/CRP-like cAMP-binding protein